MEGEDTLPTVPSAHKYKMEGEDYQKCRLLEEPFFF